MLLKFHLFLSKIQQSLFLIRKERVYPIKPDSLDVSHIFSAELQVLCCNSSWFKMLFDPYMNSTIRFSRRVTTIIYVFRQLQWKILHGLSEPFFRFATYSCRWTKQQGMECFTPVAIRLGLSKDNG